MDFLIPIRIDSVERIENLLSNIGYLTEHFHTNIYVLEASHTNNHLLEKNFTERGCILFYRRLRPYFSPHKIHQYISRKKFWQQDRHLGCGCNHRLSTDN